MIYKLYLRNKSVFVMAVVFILTMIFITAPIVNSVNAADKEGPDYVCSHVSGSGTIGQVKCCSTIPLNHIVLFAIIPLHQAIVNLLQSENSIRVPYFIQTKAEY